MSILRFKTSAVANPQNQLTTIGISNCGFEVTVTKQKSKNKNDKNDDSKKQASEF